MYLLDGHPFANVFDADDPDLPGLRIAPNAHYLGCEPAREEWPYTYASDRQIASPVKYEWTHSIGDIVNAVVDAGLRVEFVDEFPFDGWQRFKFMRYDGTWWRIDGDPIPLMIPSKPRARCDLSRRQARLGRARSRPLADNCGRCSFVARSRYCVKWQLLAVSRSATGADVSPDRPFLGLRSDEISQRESSERS